MKIDKDSLYGYSVKIAKLKDGEWLAEVPQLNGCKAVAETPQEAMDLISEFIEEWLSVAKDEGWQIPEPKTYKEVEYSGKFTLRIPRSFHRLLVEQAENEGVSLNQYILSLLSFNAGSKLGRYRL